MLNKNQQLAVDSNAQKILVLAGAGSGKTTVLLSRISRLVSEGVVPQDILVLTFTNAAAKNMKDRYKKENKGASIPRFGTFHGFCYSLIISNFHIRQHMGYSDIPTIATDEQIKKLKQECKLICGTKISDEVLEGRKPCSTRDRFQYDIFWKKYNKMFKERNMITFDMMCYEICKLFTENNPMIQQYKTKYQHIFVDEFQDTDPRQWDFVSSFTESNIFVVGDVKQAIYAFRGADSEIIKSLASNSDWETIKLSNNYRSTKQICEFSNEIHSCWKSNPYNLDIVSDVDGDDVRVLRDCELPELLGEVLSDSHIGTVAIICRSNAEVSDIRKFLKDRHIPFKSNAKENKNLDIIKAACDSEYCIDWLSDLLPPGRYNQYIKMSAIDPLHSTEAEFFKNYSDVLGDEIKKVVDVRTIISGSMPAISKLTTICSLLRIKCKSPILEDESTENIIKFLERLTNPDTDDITLYVGTIHSVKGLEYDTVYVIGVNGDSFQVDTGYEDLLNIYYVACTRAKKKLVVCEESRCNSLCDDWWSRM